MIVKPIGPYPTPGKFGEILPQTNPGTGFEDRGTYLLQTSSGSTFAYPNTFCVKNECGFTDYVKGQTSSTTFGFTPACVKYQLFTGSLSATVPDNASEAEITEFLQLLKDQAIAALVFRNCSAGAGPNV